MSVIKVIHDYTPNAEDAKRSRPIKQGQVFNLIEKTNCYWWLVRDDTAANHFYVPSLFVEEVSPELVLDLKKENPDVAVCADNIEETLKMLDDALDGEDVEDEQNNCQYMSVVKSRPTVAGEERLQSQPFKKSALPRTSLADFKYIEQPKHVPLSSFTRKTPLDNASELGSQVRTSNDSVSSNGSSSDALYIRTAQRAAEEPAPDYANLNEQEESIFYNLPEPKPMSRAEDVLPVGWEIHVDHSGRPFYMHKITKKTSWTLPSANQEDVAVQSSNTQPNQDSNLSANKMSTFHPSGPLDVPIVISTVLSPQDVSSVRAISAQPSPVSGNSEVRAAAKMAKPPSLPVLHNLPSMDTKRASVPAGGDSSTTNNTVKASQLQEFGQNINRTKVTENGKKCRKNWSVVYVHTDGRYLYFYKQALSPKSNQKPEAILDLVNAEVKTGTEVEQKSSKKHVISVQNQSSEYLLNTENAEDLISWATVLMANIKILRSMSPESLPSESEKMLSLKKHSSSTAASLDEFNKKKNVEKLNEFLPKRKTIKDLKDKNIYKLAPVFGNHLQLLCEREKTLVPRFVVKCINAVEKKGLAATGIYRVPGNLAEIQSLRFVINKDEKYEKYEELATKWDVFVLAGALKLFFRELQEPLFTFALFEAFLRTIEEKDEKVRIKQERELLDRLPLINKETTKVLFRHLANVATHTAENQMSNRSLAIVFGPTLLWPELSNHLELGTLLICQSRVVENILTDLAEMF